MSDVPYSELTSAGEFLRRHLGPSDDDVAAMLAELGFADLEELTEAVVPASIRIDDRPDVPGPWSEAEVVARLAELAAGNEVYTSLIGMGYHGTFLPPVIRRNVLENPGWYTAYTPYQPEISQGRLEALLTFQTMVADLTGMEIANASLLDEATAAAEAMAMFRRVSRKGSSVFYVDAEVHPQTLAVLETRARPIGIDVVVGPLDEAVAHDPFGVLVQYPGTHGDLRDHRGLVDAVHEAGGLVAFAVDLLAMTLVVPPGELGADAAVGSSQRFGVPMMFGGPHAAFLAAKEAHRRQMPGRIVGVSKDAAGRMALRLALQTREQHIRREKATSNICTAQVLLAVLAAFYAVYHGPEGLRRIAERTHRLASAFAAAVRAAGFALVNDTWFDTVTVVVDDADAVLEAARERRINLRRVDDRTVGVAFDETSTDELLATVVEVFGGDPAAVGVYLNTAPTGIPASLRRTSDYLTHPVFHRYRSETEMLRYLRWLQDKDLALDRTMIPLGSCTMKLNATTEMLAITWPEFADLHPFAPVDQARGYLELIGDLERWLAELTGYDAVSLQPNSGAQGELTGLLMIRAYHESRGEGHRDVCLIPASAHGTNPASATMAGLRVVVVGTAEDGSIDLDDLRAKAAEHADRLAAIMITYPSTHGVFEPEVVEVCDVVHEHGGQVYIDGANLNAMVGLAAPGRFGGDVSHLNLHKTFAIPHGGGGPGVGPVACKAHLAPFLPGHPVVATGRSGPAVAAAPWGSAGILPISWAYIVLMGAAGLRKASQVAILNANYVARRLEDAFPVLYKGTSGLVAHECILDLRGIQRETHVTNEDVAKRLIDYGFHAPTMSFPVAGTLMVEPTESESRRELDRFVEAMWAIRREIDEVAAGRVEVEESVLRRAPHPAEDLLDDRWDRPYSPREAAYPVEGLRRHKYWVPVSRIDNAWGDRHVVCACPPIEVYEHGLGDD
ncbi:MAG TPA: glycine dehydrogenase (aminomethyl-transferring) [Actinobacteria bacterium]|nr:glycine dehydrogenase (aminomethyl-transferring) [Actinomycetota bacterium]